MEKILEQILSEIKMLHFDINVLKEGQQNLEQGFLRLEHRQDRFEKRQDRFEKRQEKSEQRLDKFEQGLKRLETGQEEIKLAVLRLEESQPKDIMAIIDRIDKKLDRKDDEIAVLNKRMFNVETELERLNRQ